MSRNSTDWDEADRRAVAGPTNIWRFSGVVILLLFLLCSGAFVAMLLPMIADSRDAARQSVSKGHLKKIGLAAHNFHDLQGHLPPVAVGETIGDRTLTHPMSFYTVMLPYLEQGPLYAKVNFDQPWDSPANADAFRTLFPELLNPNIEQQTGPKGYALTHYVPNSHLIGPGGGGVKFDQITDGTGHTFLAGEIAEDFPPWGQPGMARDPRNGLAGGPNAFGAWPGGCHMLMADGSVRFVSDDIDPGVLRRLSLPADGEGDSGLMD